MWFKVSESECQQNVLSYIIQQYLTIWSHLSMDFLFPQIVADGSMIHIMASLHSLWLGWIGNVFLFLLYPLLRTGDYLWMCDDVLFYQWLTYCVYVVWYWVWLLGVRESSYVNHMGSNLYFCNIKQAFNGNGILLYWLLRSINKKWNFSREKFSGNQTWNRFPVALSISDPTQKNDM